MTFSRSYIALMASALLGWSLYGYLSLREIPPTDFSAPYIQKNIMIDLEYAGQQNLAVMANGRAISHWVQSIERKGAFQLGNSATANIEKSQIQAGCRVAFPSRQYAITRILDHIEGKAELSADALSSEIKGIYALNIQEREIALNSYLAHEKTQDTVTPDVAITEDKSVLPSHAAISHKFNTPFWAMTFRPNRDGYLEILDLSMKNANGAVGEYFVSIHETEHSEQPMDAALHTQSFLAEEIPDTYQERSFSIPPGDVFLQKGKTYAVVLSTIPLDPSAFPLTDTNPHLQRGREAAFLEWYGLGSSYDEGSNLYSAKGRYWTPHDRDLFLRTHIRPSLPPRLLIPEGTYAAIFKAPFEHHTLMKAKLTVEARTKSNGRNNVYLSFGAKRSNEEVWYTADRERDIFLPIVRKLGGKWQIKDGRKKKTSWEDTSFSDAPSAIAEAIRRFPNNASTLDTFNGISSESWEGSKLLVDVDQIGVAVILQKGKTDISFDWAQALTLTGYMHTQDNGRF
jgi:hypothetical protein